MLDPVAVDMVSNADHLGGNATGAAISKPDQARSQIRILNLVRSSLTPQQSITIDALQALIIQGLDAKCYALLSSSCNPAYRDSSVTPAGSDGEGADRMALFCHPAKRGTVLGRSLLDSR